MPKHSALFAILPILFLKTSAYAQTPDASPELTIWDHNGSVMYLVANGSSREFYYEKPRPGMLEAGARPGSLLFRGEVNDGQYSGTAYIFNPRCGKIPFQVKGTILDNDERIVLTGQAPRLRRNCQTYAAYTSNLEFKLLKSIAASTARTTGLRRRRNHHHKARAGTQWCIAPTRAKAPTCIDVLDKKNSSRIRQLAALPAIRELAGYKGLLTMN